MQGGNWSKGEEQKETGERVTNRTFHRGTRALQGEKSGVTWRERIGAGFVRGIGQEPARRKRTRWEKGDRAEGLVGTQT